jgi:hypothetical protein
MGMRRAFLILLMFAVLFIVGCTPPDMAASSGSSDVEPTQGASLSIDKLQTIEDNIAAQFFRKIPYNDVLVSHKDGVYNLTVFMSGSEYITDFGEYIIISKEIFESEFVSSERGKLYITLFDDNGEHMIAYSTSSSNYGLIIDGRSGESEIISLKDIDDLYEIFPAASIYANKSELDENDIAIYEEVWSVLETEYDRPEDEIFEEMAPKYGMTAEELHQFMLDMMDKIY